MEPWHPTVYVKEVFTQKLPVRLESAWRIAERDITYLGNIRLKEQGLFVTENQITTDTSISRRPSKLPPDKELNDTRKAFARILQQEGVLQYLRTETDLSQQPCIIGWTSQGFSDMVVDGNVNASDETLVIFRPNAKH